MENSQRETESMNKRFGIIRNDQSEMNVSKLAWDLIWHKNENCVANKRPDGCLVCDHDVESCDVEDCQICAKRNGTLQAAYTPEK